MSDVQTFATSRRAHLRWDVGLWSAQIALALLYGTSGIMNTFMAPESLVSIGMNYVTDIPHWLLRFIGISELAGTAGVILPALLRIMPNLTPLAALGFTTIQVLAIGFHSMRGEFAEMAPLNLAMLALSLFVLWGRTRKAPVSPR
jgi:uncharacterized membrane protein YphA (DoxX/SURF4 family)